MDTDKVGHWVQIISGIALIIGIALVIVQMNQTKQLIRAQLAADSVGLALTRYLTFMGESPMEAMAKACDPDETLTMTDALILSHVFAAWWSTIVREHEVSRIAEFEGERWKGVARNNFPQIFATQHGRDWWALRSRDLPSSRDSIREYANEILADLGPPSCSGQAAVILTADEKKSAAN